MRSQKPKRKFPVCNRPKGTGKGLTPKDVNQVQLRMGIKTEQEHTRSKRQACAIAIDHLAEDPKYYTKLKKAGL